MKPFFKYAGIHYPVFGSAVGWENGRYKSEMSRLVGGYGDNYGKWWTFSWGWKTRVWNKAKPLKQFIVDAVADHPEMEIEWRWFEDSHPEQGGMWAVVHAETKQYLGNLLDAFYMTPLTQITHGTGFNISEQKWYGWSHRAKYGFGVGSTVKKGDVAYKARNPHELVEACLRFWGDVDYPKKVEKIEHNYLEDFNNTTGVMITFDTTEELVEGGVQQTGEFIPYPETWGRGEWTAETLEDAHEMALAFSDGVS